MNKIIVLGGGSAGWMTAATLINTFPKKEIVLIESPNTPIIGVGESTLGQINKWLNLLNIKDKDFMPHTDASYKLSIRFENFYEKGDGGFHYPFGRTFENDLSWGKQNWFVKKYLNKKINNSDYANFINPNMALVNSNKLFKNDKKELESFNFKNDTAYHFDAIKFGIWLKNNYCIPKGVKHVVEDIKNIKTNKEGIVSLNKHTADLYFDCTGFRSVLMNKIGAKFESYSDLLPNNKAWATRVPYKNKKNQLEPFTNCTAIENGWVWNIPSWERIGTGYVYSDKYVTDKQALKEFKKHLDHKKHNYNNSTFKNITMRVGRFEKIFYKNVCSIGLSAGFIEPLESNGLLSVHEFLLNLLDIFERHDNITQHDKDCFNIKCGRFFDKFTDFVAQHYAYSKRNDTKYWKDIRNKSFLELAKSDSVFLDMAVRYDFLRNNEYFNSFFGEHYITTGMNFYSQTNKNLQNSGFDLSKIIKENNQRDILVKKWNNIVKDKPTLLKFLTKNIHK